MGQLQSILGFRQLPAAFFRVTPTPHLFPSPNRHHGIHLNSIPGRSQLYPIRVTVGFGKGFHFHYIPEEDKSSGWVKSFPFRATNISRSENTTLHLRWFSIVLQQLCVILKKENTDLKLNVIATTLQGNELHKILRL
jgi:ribosomal protein L28